MPKTKFDHTYNAKYLKAGDTVWVTTWEFEDCPEDREVPPCRIRTFVVKDKVTEVDYVCLVPKDICEKHGLPVHEGHEDGTVWWMVDQKEYPPPPQEVLDHATVVNQFLWLEESHCGGAWTLGDSVWLTEKEAWIDAFNDVENLIEFWRKQLAKNPEDVGAKHALELDLRWYSENRHKDPRST